MNQIALSVGDPASIAIISTLNLIDTHLKNPNPSFRLNIFADRNWLKVNALKYFSDNQRLIECFDNQSFFDIKNKDGHIHDTHHTEHAHPIQFHHQPLHEQATLGLPNQKNAPAVINSLNQAIDFVQSQPKSALVTGAVDKAIIQSVKPDFIGHTEYLAEKLNQNVLMSFLIQDFHAENPISPNLHLALASDHCSLKESIKRLEKQNFLSEKIKLFAKELERQFKIKQPKIAVLGLNPHAGENGSLGREEIKWIKPVIESLKEQNINLFGPIAADSAFLIAKKQNLNGLVSLYHDQLLPLVKYSFFNQSVNITLGLNIIRTSVDHGTAFDIANQPDLIDSNPLLTAVLVACEMIDIQLG